jgi:hypothetical protein
VRLETTTGAVNLDTARAAMLVVDMQNDFGAKGGMFDRAGIDISAVRDAIAPTIRALDTARRAGIPVVFLKMGTKMICQTLVEPVLPIAKGTSTSLQSERP